MANWTKWNHPYNSEPAHHDDIFEPWMAAWRPFIRPGDLCFDVGGYTGDTAVPMAALAGPTGAVYVFEPNRAVLPTLLANAIQPDGYAPIAVIAAAAAAETGRTVFHYSDPQFCNGGRLLSQRKYEVKHVHPQVVTTIDFEPFARLKPAFVKLDTEGNDAVLIDMLLTFAGPRLVIQTEFYPDETEAERLAHWNMLRSGRRINLDGSPATFDQIKANWKSDILAIYGS